MTGDETQNPQDIDPEGVMPGDAQSPEASSPEESSEEKGPEDVWKDKYLRLLADFDNHRKRTVRDLEEGRRYANEALLRDFLPVLDNLERAIAHAKDGSELGSGCQGLLEGLRLTAKQFLEMLEKNGVTRILSEGQPFDPSVHEAVGYAESSTHPEGRVVEVYQQGYRIQNRLVRPAMVTVSRGSST
ncbi:MAG: nucleotide exchange factor GrpE [Leptospirillia bacterium]